MFGRFTITSTSFLVPDPGHDLYSVHSAPNSLHCIYCILYTVYCILYTVHSILYTLFTLLLWILSDRLVSPDRWQEKARIFSWDYLPLNCGFFIWTATCEAVFLCQSYVTAVPENLPGAYQEAINKNKPKQGPSGTSHGLELYWPYWLYWLYWLFFAVTAVLPVLAVLALLA